MGIIGSQGFGGGGGGGNDENKQDKLISGTNIKTLEGQSLLGAGNIDLTKNDVGLGNVPNLDTSTTVNIVDSTDKRFVTDAQKSVLSQAPANTLKGNPTGANGNPQDIPVLPNSSVGRVDELNSGNITNIPFLKTLIGQVTLINGSVTVFDSRITTNSIAFYTPTSTGTLSSVPLRVTCIAGQCTFSNGQVGDNATINFQIYF